jgi:hypothetical protein
MKLRYCESWSVVRLADGTPVVVTYTERRGYRVVKLGRDRGREVSKDEEVEVIQCPAELAHLYLEQMGVRPTPKCQWECSRCHQMVDNVTPGYSIVTGGAIICSRCLQPGEEIARAKSVYAAQARSQAEQGRSGV